MSTTYVNIERLQQAINEFGSLQAATNAVESKKKKLEAEISALSTKLKVMKQNEAQALDKIKRIDRTIVQREQDLQNFENAFEKYKQDVDEFIVNNKQFMLQYYMFEKFVAMLHTSPSNKKSVQKLASLMILLSDTFWKFSQEPHKLRQFFVYAVLGSYLYCCCCDRCGLKFIANQEVRSHILGYYCPNCGSLSSMRADDSFLKAMLNTSEYSATNETQEQEE